MKGKRFFARTSRLSANASFRVSVVIANPSAGSPRVAPLVQDPSGAASESFKYLVIGFARARLSLELQTLRHLFDVVSMFVLLVTLSLF
jgi:hypothetical protein